MSENKRFKQLKEGTEIFFTAFSKKLGQDQFFVCKGVITRTPKVKGRQIYKVKINAIATHPIGGSDSSHQANLLGKQIIKKVSEFTEKLPEFMKPSDWIKVTKNE